MGSSNDVRLEDLARALLRSESGLRIPPVHPNPKPNSIGFNLIGVEGIPYHLVAMTTYGAKGEKNYRAMPLDRFLSVVTKFENAAFRLTYNLKQKNREVLSFENTVAGHGSKSMINTLAAAIDVHRYAFIRDECLGDFLRKLMSAENTSEWKMNNIDVHLSYNKYQH